jgi:hypothetical protein
MLKKKKKIRIRFKRKRKHVSETENKYENNRHGQYFRWLLNIVQVDLVL